MRATWEPFRSQKLGGTNTFFIDMVLHSPSSHLLLSSDLLCSRRSCAWGIFTGHFKQAEAALRRVVLCLLLVSGPSLPTHSVFASVCSWHWWAALQAEIISPGLCTTQGGRSKGIASLPLGIPRLYSHALASPQLLWHCLPSNSNQEDSLLLRTFFLWAWGHFCYIQLTFSLCFTANINVEGKKKKADFISSQDGT